MPVHAFARMGDVHCFQQTLTLAAISFNVHHSLSLHGRFSNDKSRDFSLYIVGRSRFLNKNLCELTTNCSMKVFYYCRYTVRTGTNGVVPLSIAQLGLSQGVVRVAAPGGKIPSWIP